jgi:hypothetical protein
LPCRTLTMPLPTPMHLPACISPTATLLLCCRLHPSQVPAHALPPRAAAASACITLTHCPSAVLPLLLPSPCPFPSQPQVPALSLTLSTLLHHPPLLRYCSGALPLPHPQPQVPALSANPPHLPASPPLLRCCCAAAARMQVPALPLPPHRLQCGRLARQLPPVPGPVHLQEVPQAAPPRAQAAHGAVPGAWPHNGCCWALPGAGGWGACGGLAGCTGGGGEGPAAFCCALHSLLWQCRCVGVTLCEWLGGSWRAGWLHRKRR